MKLHAIIIVFLIGFLIIGIIFRYRSPVDSFLYPTGNVFMITSGVIGGLSLISLVICMLGRNRLHEDRTLYEKFWRDIVWLVDKRAGFYS